MRASEDDKPRTAGNGGTYAWYVVAVLFWVYVVNFIDRQIISILAQDIKVGLGISDAQIGVLYGTVFGIFYAIFGIPVGYVVDRWHRVRIIALGLTLWSGMTVFSGFASSYAQLVGARMGVAIGEATASPAAYSIIGDYFNRSRRAFALSVYSAGLHVGSGLSLPLGGWIAHTWSQRYTPATAPFGLAGWQAAFLAVGLPGLLLATWVSTIREPPRGLADGNPMPATQPGAWRGFARQLAALVPPLTLWNLAGDPKAFRRNLFALIFIASISTFLAVLTGDHFQWYPLGIGIYSIFSWTQTLRATDRPAHELIWGTPAVLYALAGFACMTFVMYSSYAWISTYVIRTFGLRPDEVGLMIGLPGGAATAVGIVLGGKASDSWRRRSASGRIYVCMVSVLLAPPFYVAALAADAARWVFVLAPLGAMLANMWLGSGAAVIQECVLPRMRGLAAATFFISTTAGLAVGPYFAGRISALTGSLRLGILSIFLISPFALFFLWRTSRLLPHAEGSKERRALAAGEPLPAI